MINAGLRIRHAPRTQNRTPVELIALLEDVVAAIASSDPFDAKVLKAARNLKVIARTGVGTDSIDLAAAKANHVIVITTQASVETCADHTIAMMLAALRQVVGNDAAVRAGKWSRTQLPLGDLHGARVGIVGAGRIGSAVARRLTAFGSAIRICDPALQSSEEPRLASLTELLAWADIVTLHVPLIASTRGLLGEREIRAMRSSAILVNTSRGGIVDERALVSALRSDRIRGAALDVFEHEPPVDSELLQITNVTLSPHVGGLSEGSMQEMLGVCVGAVLDVLFDGMPREGSRPQEYQVIEENG
ncbi:MAG: NAD(P)-dependent oxidoreductase [Candidatus Dormibacteraceae bacterium]